MISLHEGRVVLHPDDCLNVLRSMGNDSVDHCIGDPPYEQHMHAQRLAERRIRLDGGSMTATLDFDSVDRLRPLLAPELVRVCRGWLILFCTPEGVAPWRDAIEAAGARYKRACVWVKPDAAPQFNGQGPAMGAEMFCAAWCGSGVSRWNGGGRRNVFTHPCNPPERDGGHPTEKPLALMREIVRLFTQPDDTVFDPCMGSGATGLACLAEGRRFIGCEIAEHYFDMAQRRVAGFGLSPNAARALRWQGFEEAGPLFAGEGA